MCVLLAALFLYNPFLAACQASGSNTVCHRPSYRSTVASSELQQLAQPIANAVAPSPDAELVRLLIPKPQADKTAARYFLEQEVVVTPQTGFSSSLWFRPPPAV